MKSFPLHILTVAETSHLPKPQGLVSLMVLAPVPFSQKPRLPSSRSWSRCLLKPPSLPPPLLVLEGGRDGVGVPDSTYLERWTPSTTLSLVSVLTPLPHLAPPLFPFFILSLSL